MRVFSRLAAVSVRLANLAVLAGLMASEIFTRRFETPIKEGGFSQRYVYAVIGMGPGGALMGGLLAAIFTLSGTFGAPVPVSELTTWALLAVLWVCFLGTLYGGVLGLFEGFIIALPLAKILGLLRGGAQT